ncbi:ATPase family AAA domain-containing protein 2 [Temnothorax longispinosus]|uniref:Tat-binding homolog 7 n=1 Tax=Temnothorax longispinosus TaxID=300112 RepID=A0A4S2L0E3_9HYME|nr:ATPase family AAA domain-containing protein 2 [Temnothorax longispinosus]
MKIMSDDDPALDSMDTEEEIFVPRNHSLEATVRRSKSLRKLRSHSGSNSHLTRNNLSVRRSTRNRMQTYDNLNTSWILGTQTLKGYPMFQQHPSSSDKEMVDDVPGRKRDLRDRMPLRSRENHPPNKTPTRHLRDRTEHDRQNSRELRARADRDLKERTEPEKDSDSPSRFREGPVTRLCGSVVEKTEKPKVEQEEADDDSSRESEKPDNNDNDNSENEDGYEDMYTRIKRTRRTAQRQLPRVEDSDLSESSDSPGPRKYSLRQKKPTVDRFQANVEPVRRSIRALRSVLSNSMRRRKHRNKSTSSADSTDSEPQRYDKKKGKKARQSTIQQGGPPDRKADINPITLDTNIRFSDVGGLRKHIECLKEMVIFPMLYPDILECFDITPPKGVLFYGPPGTGKTLIARALANECSQGNTKMAFFMRKGADCLSKWVGESERQLRLLFEQAQQMKPSIIFFDEIDGLAPVRSTKQDQIHASIVSTLLALMDGLSDRGQVIVIGATNRIDAIDPALRRPGRFDRELCFALPAKKERLEILKIHVSKWKKTPSEQLLEILAEKATGYCGSDLRALCTEAVLQALRRTYPQIYMTNDRLLLDPERVQVKKRDFMQASSMLVPSSHRVAPCAGRKLQPFMEPLLAPPLEELLNLIKGTFPQGVNPAMAKMRNAKGIYRPRLLISGGSLSEGQGPHLAQALLHCMEHLPVQILDVSTLFAESARSPEETCVQVFNEAVRNVPSTIYIRSINQWWPLVPETVKAVFLCRIAALDPSLPILILATSDATYQDLPNQLKSLFSELRGEVYSMKTPTTEQRMKFFRPIFIVQSLRQPQIKSNKVEVLETLPLAPNPLPKKLTEQEKRIMYEKDEVSLRELRIFLREICAKLARNRQFFMFTKPVDTEEVPDYNQIIKQPMDLETMMTKIDMNCYLCAREFLDDIDLICRNALEYNPDRDPADKLIRHRACSLRDNAYALIKAELDSDFEDKCREISKTRRILENNCDNEEESKNSKLESTSTGERAEKKESVNSSHSLVVNGKKFGSSRKRKIPAWARGYVKKIHKKKKIAFDESVTEIVANKSLNNETTTSIDLEKFQEFETEANSVLNGHMGLFDNTDSENDSQNENSKGSQNGTVVDQRIDNLQMEISFVDEDKPMVNGDSSSSSRRESMDDLSFAIESSDTSRDKIEENEKIVVDKSELENAWHFTVEITKDFPVEVLCDIYVQLSRCVGKYAQKYDRKSLPKDLLKEVEKFTEYKSQPEVEIDRFGSFRTLERSMSGATKDFSCIGGLEKHIRIVKEMVLFPLMYGDGSDCLSKWVGESEKKLEKIFSLVGEAQQTKPCIIFFDEVDGLAPVRSSRQDFVHASVVSTLLALMDGLDSNSEIIVIGATNRIDAIDPALRRPGRFDKELYFPLPCYSARKEILSVLYLLVKKYHRYIRKKIKRENVHIKSWKQKPTQKFLAYLASKTLGFCGSDLQALCAEAVMCSVRRNYPQIYNSKSKYHINERHLKVEKEDFLKARQNIVPASHRVIVAPIKSLSLRIQPLLQEDLAGILSRLQTLCPAGMLTSDNITGKATSKSSGCPRILLCGDDAHTRHLGPALLHTLEHLPCHILDITTLFEETGKAAEEAMIQKIKTARRTLPALLYMPGVLTWWDLVDETTRVVFTSLMRGLDRSVHMLVLMTAHCRHVNLPSEVDILFVFSTRSYFTFYIFLHMFQLRAFMQEGSDLASILCPKKLKGETRKLRNHVHPADSSGLLAPSSTEKLFSSQIEDLVETIVKSTDEWPSHLLESLFSSLELTMENNGDLRATVNEYVVRYEELKRVKMRAKQEED